jgi:hypothetical protein
VTAPGPIIALRDAARGWGTTAHERAERMPGDEVAPRPVSVVDRGIDVDAEPAVVFRWLCQLKLAPYSYDLLDNFGRRSPRKLRPGTERLEVGQRFMFIFRLVDFEQDHHITLRTRGGAVVTYVVRPRGSGARLLCRVRLRAGVPARVLAYGDLFMMQKQLRTLRDLAEREGRPSG